MKVHAQKQPQQQASASVTRASAKPTAASSTAHPLIYLQRTIGNQAVQRLLRAGTEGLNSPVLQRQAASGGDPAAKTEEPSPRALMLLDMFTKNRSRFTRFTGMEFQREANDKDASAETIQSKGGTSWTYKFVTNKRTGAIYVRQSQDGTEIVNYYQPVASEEYGTEKFEIEFFPTSDEYVNESDVITKLTPLAKLLEGNPGLRITVYGNVQAMNPKTIKGNSKAALDQTMITTSGEKKTAAKLMLERAIRVQQTLYKDLNVTNVITPTTGSVLDNSDGLKIFITISRIKN